MDVAAHYISSEGLARLGFFAGIFLTVALGERVAPRRMLLKSRLKRWVSNLGMQIIDIAALRLIFPVFPFGVAVICAQKGWGLLNYFQIPSIPAIISGVLFLDLVIYFQHRIFHLVPVFWRLHMVHHTDQDIDVTTALRFHPLAFSLSSDGRQ